MYGGADRRGVRKPLVIFTPKSLLRHPRAVSTPARFCDRRLHRNPGRAGLCATFPAWSSAPARSTTILLAARAERKANHVALVRVEQLYPFAADQAADILARYPPPPKSSGRRKSRATWARGVSCANGWSRSSNPPAARCATSAVPKAPAPPPAPASATSRSRQRSSTMLSLPAPFRRPAASASSPGARSKGSRRLSPGVAPAYPEGPVAGLVCESIGKSLFVHSALACRSPSVRGRFFGIGIVRRLNQRGPRAARACSKVRWRLPLRVDLRRIFLSAARSCAGREKPGKADICGALARDATLVPSRLVRAFPGRLMVGQRPLEP